MTKIVRICFAFIFSNFCYKLSIIFFSTYTPYKFSFVYKITTKKQNYSSHSSDHSQPSQPSQSSHQSHSSQPSQPSQTSHQSHSSHLSHIFARAARTPTSPTRPTRPTSPTRPTRPTSPTRPSPPSLPSLPRSSFHLFLSLKKQHFFLLHLPFTSDIGRIHSQRRISEGLAKG